MMRTKVIRTTAVLFYFTGCLGLVMLPVTAYTIYTGLLPSVWAPTLGLRGANSGFVESLPFEVVIAAGLVFAAVSALEILAGNWLWKSRKKGGRLGIILLPVGITLSIAMVLPIWIVAHTVKVVLLALKWKTLN